VTCQFNNAIVAASTRPRFDLRGFARI